MAITPEVRTGLRSAASGLLVAAGAWQEDDQRAFDTSGTQIRRAFGMSLDELAFEIFAFLEEDGETDHATA